MIAYQITCTGFLIAGLFLIFGVRLSDITRIIFRPLQKNRDKQKKIRYLTGKRYGFIQRQILEAELMLTSAGMNEQLSTYKAMAVILVAAGFLFGLLLDNLLVSAVLSIGLLASPLTIIRIRTGEYMRGLNSRLEAGMGIITNAYIQSGDLFKSVEEFVHLLPAPLDTIFRRFLVETKLIDASLIRAIEQMRSRISNRFWRDWCSVLIQCQHDRSLRFALPGIVERLGEMRRAQMEVDTTIQKHFGDYLVTVLIVLGSIPLMGFMMPEWYDMLMHSLAGKITLAVVLFAVLTTSVWVARINQPVSLDGGGDVPC